MNELEQVIIGDSAAAPPAAILEGLDPQLAHRPIEHVPHTIYQELWHIAFWQQITLDRIRGIDPPFPTHASEGFPTEKDALLETWDDLRERFLAANQIAAEAARDASGFERLIRCSSPPGQPVRIMTVREQLESLGAHNAYHFGRIVLLRQLFQSWPPPSGGNTW